MGKRGTVYNSIFSKEEWILVNPENIEIMEDYKLELKQNQKKESTILQYFNDWRIIMIYILRRLDNRCILELNKKDFRKFSLWLSDELKVSNARANRLMSALRSLLTYCEEDDDREYENNTARRVKGLPKKEVRDIVFLTNDQIFKLKDELIRLEEYQKCSLLMLAYDSSGRKNELFQVNKKCFLDEKRSYTNKVIGKRGKEFVLLYFEETKKCVKLYLEQRGQDNLDEMWITGTGDNKKPVTSASLYEWCLFMNNILEKLEGKSIGFNVHSLRHSSLEEYSEGSHYVCKLLGKEDGFALEELQLLANHSSSDTTAGYLRDKKEEKLAQMFGINLSGS